MENSKEQNILGVIIDNKLNFKSHVSELCKKASQKIAVLSRLSTYLYNSEKKLIFNSIIKSQFSYCPLVWMFCSRTSNNMINKLHERSLRILLNDYSSNFNILLENNNDISNHHRSIQALLIEVFKMKNELAPPMMELILNKRFNTYNLRKFQDFGTERKRTVWYGLETFGYRYPHLWSLLPESLKEMNSLCQLKKKKLSIGYALTVLSVCVMFLFKILDFYNVKSNLLVKLANLATTISKFLFYLYIFA